MGFCLDVQLCYENKVKIPDCSKKKCLFFPCYFYSDLKKKRNYMLFQGFDASFVR